MPESLTAAEQRAYQAAGAEYIKDHPDLPELLAKAEKRGLDMGRESTLAIIGSGARGVRLAHFLAQPENFDAAKKLHDLKDESEEEQRAEVKRLLAWIDRQISGGPKAGHQSRTAEKVNHGNDNSKLHAGSAQVTR